MARAITVKDFLDRNHLTHEVLSHEPTGSSLETAHAAQVAPQRLAKGVLLNADGRYVLAITRADCHLNMGELRRLLQAPVGLATSEEIRSVFADCASGAVPPLGAAYGIETIWDDELSAQPDLYFELGDHTHLVHMRTQDYLAALGGSKHSSFSEPTDASHPSLWAAP